MGQLQFTFNKNDECYTPAYAVEPIIKYLMPYRRVWCPFDTEDSEYVKVLRAHKFEVIHSHIFTGGDFFTMPVPECDYIISNPPFSVKGQVFKRLYEIGIPFAMLMNFQGLFDHRERFELFQNHRVEMLYLSPRINYIRKDSPKSGPPFQSAYVCSGILRNQIEFATLAKERAKK